MPTRKNTSRAPSPQPHPRYIWPQPWDDLPRLDWSSWLRLIGLQIAADYPGDAGQFLSAHLLALAEHANALGATCPITHLDRAQAEADRDAAYRAALEHEVLDQAWTITNHGPDETGGWGGHPQDICEDAAQRGYFSTDPDDETWCN